MMTKTDSWGNPRTVNPRDTPEFQRRWAATKALRDEFRALAAAAQCKAEADAFTLAARMVRFVK